MLVAGGDKHEWGALRMARRAESEGRLRMGGGEELLDADVGRGAMRWFVSEDV